MTASELLQRYADGERTFPALDLTGADLSGACLRDVALGGTLLKDANLHRSDLTSATLDQADLAGANLSGASLNGALLINANMRGAKLVEADLSRADLDRVDLTAADLTRADLLLVRLNQANLCGAKLRSVSTLDSTNFAGATMTGADVEGARCHRTLWNEVDLSQVNGLETMEHLGPSTIGLNTLALSRGSLPDLFLRGCGLSEWEIEAARLYDPSLTTEQINDTQYRVFSLRAERPFQISPLFVSYSWRDGGFVDALGAHFDRNGIRYWRDKKDATAGRLDQVIDRGMRVNPTVVLILSKDSVESPWVEHEVEKSVALARELKRDVLCPIALDDSWRDSKMSGQLQTQLNKYSVLSFANWRSEIEFKAQLLKLFQGLELFYKPLHLDP